MAATDSIKRLRNEGYKKGDYEMVFRKSGEARCYLDFYCENRMNVIDTFENLSSDNEPANEPAAINWNDIINRVYYLSALKYIEIIQIAVQVDPTGGHISLEWLCQFQWSKELEIVVEGKIELISVEGRAIMCLMKLRELSKGKAMTMCTWIYMIMKLQMK